MGYGGKIRTGRAVESHKEVLRFRCITKKYGNFIYNKIYKAEASSKHINGGKYSDFRVTDEDGDYYTVYDNDLGKIFLMLTN